MCTSALNIVALNQTETLPLRRIERTIPYLFRLCAILAAFQVVVFLIAVDGLS